MHGKIKNTQSSAKKLIAAERRMKALEMRRQNMRLIDIAAAFNTTPSTIYTWIMIAIQRWNEMATADAGPIIEQEWAKTDLLLEEYMPKAIEGDVKAAEFVLRVLDRRARYRGLDAPTKVANEVSITGQTAFMSREQMMQEVKRRLTTIDANFTIPPATPPAIANCSGIANTNGKH